MTEEEWLTATDPIRLMCGLRGHASDRKMLLFELAAAESFGLAEAGQACKDYAEYATARAEGGRPDLSLDDVHRLGDDVGEESDRLRLRAMELSRDRGDGDPDTVRAAELWIAAYLVDNLTSGMAWWDWFPMYFDGSPRLHDSLFHTAYLKAFSSNLPSLRCVFGNPFRPVIVDPSWLTPTVVALADAIYADRAFDRLPILADALEEAGCDLSDVLAHCRGDGPHARGCWVVDMVLGKS